MSYTPSIFYYGDGCRCVGWLVHQFNNDTAKYDAWDTWAQDNKPVFPLAFFSRGGWVQA